MQTCIYIGQESKRQKLLTSFKLPRHRRYLVRIFSKYILHTKEHQHTTGKNFSDSFKNNKFLTQTKITQIIGEVAQYLLLCYSSKLFKCPSDTVRGPSLF